MPGAAIDRSTIEPTRFSVVVPVLNAREYLARCLDSILRALDEVGGGELVVVDNGSTDGSFEFLQSRYAHLARIEQRPGWTISALRNHGAAMTTGNVLSFVDADCVLVPSYYRVAAEVLEETGADATGCTYALPPDPHWIEAVWHRMHRRSDDGEVHYLNAGNFLCRREAFDAAGGFDEALRTGEDAELGQRLVAAGYRIYESHAVEAAHLGNPKRLGQFIRKQTWHGLGMFGTFRNARLDKPLLMTATHLVLIVAGAVWFVAERTLETFLLGVVCGNIAVPVLAVLYRSRRSRRAYWPLRGIFLYHLYFIARIYAIFKIMASKVYLASGSRSGRASRG